MLGSQRPFSASTHCVIASECCGLSGLDDAGRAEAERALLDRMSLTPADVERDVRAIIEAVRARGDAAVREYTERFEKRTLDRARAARATSGSGRRRPSPREVRRALERAARSHRALPRAAARGGLSLRGGRRAARAARAAARARRALRAGRQRALSVVGADDGGAGAHRRRARDRDGDARPIGRDAVRRRRWRACIACSSSAARRRWRRSRTARRRCRASTRSSGRATPGWPRPSGSCSAQVDIDAVAGPSEILVIADDAADPALVAADLLSQAEHDVEAYAVLVTTSRALAEATARAVDEQLATLPRREIAERVDPRATAWRW